MRSRSRFETLFEMIYYYFFKTLPDLKTALSRIDTGRTGPKTKSRINTEGFEGAAANDLVQSIKPAAAVVVAPAISAPSATLSAPSIAPARKEQAVPNVQEESDLEKEVASLKLQLQESAALAVRLEAQIREEVASEFAQEIFRTQLQCEERVAEMRETLEEKYERKIEILDELNKTSMQRHASKYQQLVDE